MKLVAVVLASVFAAASAAQPWESEPRYDDWWVMRHATFVQSTLNNNGSINVIFYGDSITEGWAGDGRDTYNQYYAPLGTANYGIGSDKAEHVRWRIANGEITDRLNPKVCVVKIGTNNIESNDDVSIATGILYIVRELRERLPNMKVLILGVLPRSNEEWTGRTSNINNVVKHMDNGNTVRFLDMKDHFYRGGNDFVTELYTGDLLHLSAAGYKKWAEVMDPLFRQMLA